MLLYVAAYTITIEDICDYHRHYAKNFVEVICNTEIISNFVLGDYSD